jgi:N-acyl-D-aspartate/D-glutamate deacylase
VQSHPRYGQLTTLFVIATVLAAIGGCAPTATTEHDIVLSGGRVMDPESGLDAVRNVGIRDGRIETISADDLAGTRNIDVTGLVVAPGFIDLHEHGQTEEAYGFMVRDGVTSALELERGVGDVEAFYAERAGGQIVNYGASIGHIPVRMIVMDDPGGFLPSGPANNTEATDKQVAEMARRVDEGLDQGAPAVGFGLAYTPAASDEEIRTMFETAAAHGAVAHVHVAGGPEGLAGTIALADETSMGLHIVHSNSSGAARSAAFIDVIEEAQERGQDVTTEAYPYEASATSIESALFDDWESWPDERFGLQQWVATGERLTRESFVRYRAQGGPVISHVRTEEMTLAAFDSPLTMVASDGLIHDGQGHPRGAGTFGKVLGRYVRELGVFDLMDALRRMSLEPARRLEHRLEAMRDKGRIRVGADADITVFNPDTVIDQATYAEPAQASKGFEYVLVNGVVVVDAGELVDGVRAGLALRAEVDTGR